MEVRERNNLMAWDPLDKVVGKGCVIKRKGSTLKWWVFLLYGKLRKKLGCTRNAILEDRSVNVGISKGCINKNYFN